MAKTLKHQKPYKSVRTNSFAIISFIFGLLFFIPLAPLIAIIFGFLALSQIKHTKESGKGFAIAGIILGFVWIVLLLLLLVFVLAVFSEMMSAGLVAQP